MNAMTAYLALSLAALGANPPEDVAIDQVDLIEINHFYDEQGKRIFDQVIFYDWSPIDSRHHVRAWRLLKTPSQWPVRRWEQGQWVAVWHDGEVLRKVRATAVRESWTQYDPELVEREFLPKERRRELLRLTGQGESGR